MKPAPSNPQSFLSLYTLQWGLVVLMLAAVVGVCLYALKYFDQPVPKLKIAFKDVDVSPGPPAYVAGHFMAEVENQSGLTQMLDTTDPTLANHLTAAFGLHPWVEEVEQVGVTPGSGIQVRLRYRVPVALVTLRRDRYPLDATGRILPDVPASYRLIAIETNEAPRGKITEAYGVPVVQSAARLASLLAPHREAWGLRSIRVVKDPIAAEQREFRIVTEKGAEVLWGGVDEGKSVESWENRLERLRAHLQQYQSIEADGTYELDLRDPKTIYRKKR